MIEAPFQDLVGQTIGGTYTIEEFMGAGGMASVWRASYHVGHDIRRKAAVKILHREFVETNPTIREMLFKEARIISELQDPHIVPIYGCGEDVKTKAVYIAMEKLEGVTLEDEIEKKRQFQAGEGTFREDPLPPAGSVKIMSQILGVMAKVHALRPSEPVIHRDLKPSNVMLTDASFAYLLDFGIAKFREVTGPEGPGFLATSENMVMGTYPYMSPEHWNRQFCPGSDIFSLGIMLFEMLTGKKPFGGDGGEDDNTILNNIIHKPHPDLAVGQMNGAAYRPFQPIVDKALAKKPEDRYLSCRGFLKDLEGVDLTIRTSSGAMRVVGAIAGFAAFLVLGYLVGDFMF
jgi:serine/threonine protein kinase